MTTTLFHIDDYVIAGKSFAKNSVQRSIPNRSTTTRVPSNAFFRSIDLSPAMPSDNTMTLSVPI